MTQETSSPPSLVYRGLDRCDLCGGRLTPGEQLAGLFHACRWPESLREHRGTQKATRTRPPVVASRNQLPEAH
jgi:hypothetical protein